MNKIKEITNRKVVIYHIVHAIAATIYIDLPLDFPPYSDNKRMQETQEKQKLVDIVKAKMECSPVITPIFVLSCKIQH
jgi:hypothetical protein